MAITIVTRASKGAALNATEFDANLTNLAAAVENTTSGHDHDGIDSKKVAASNVVNTPAGDIAATDVQAALNELDTEKAPKASPTITGHPTIEGVTATGATGTGKMVFDTSPTLVTPILGTPTSGALDNCTSNTEADNNNTTQLATTAFAKSQDAVLAREPDQGVAMTYAASGSTGIRVADNDNIDFGTGNFTLVWKGLLFNWRYNNFPFFTKIHGIGAAIAFAVMNGYFRVYLSYGDISYQTTIANSLQNGTSHECVAVITRETETTPGSVVFYIDGLLFASVVIPAGVPISVSNSKVLWINGTEVQRDAGICNFAATYNRALTAAEVLDLYRNGIAESDKWGSQTAVYNYVGTSGHGDFSTYKASVTSNESIGGRNALKILGSANTDLHAAQGPATILPTKKYVVSYDYYVPSTNTNCDGFYFYGDPYPTILIDNRSAVKDTWTSVSVEIVSNHNKLGFVFADGAVVGFSTGGDYIGITNFTVREIGATLALEPGGAQPAPGQWLDSSSNKLHAMQPAAGSSLTRYKKDFEYRWTNVWTASSAAQYIGGLNQAVLSADHFITDVITQATVTTDVENLTLGDGSDADRFVTAFAPSATRTKQTIAAQNDGTNLKLVYTPAAEATMTVETIIRGFIWEP